jgi:Cu+-exporting ATPase
MELTDVVALGEEAIPDGGQLKRPDSLTEDDVLRLAATAERGSEHPLARAIVAGAEAHGIEVSDADDFENVPGHGVRARIEAGALPGTGGDGPVVVLVGNRKLLRDNGIDPAPADDTMERLEREGKTAMLVGRVPAGTDGVPAGTDGVPAGTSSRPRTRSRRVRPMP